MNSKTKRRSKTKLRMVSCRGRSYIQEVSYYWDKESKRGVTRIIKHLGPANPINKSKHPVADIMAAKLRLNEERNERLSREAKREKREKGRSVKRQHYSLDPPEDMLKKVLGIIENEPQGLGRTGAIGEFKLKYDDHTIDEKALAALIGISLTVLHRQKAIERLGGGVRGNPFTYYSNNKRAPSETER